MFNLGLAAKGRSDAMGLASNGGREIALSTNGKPLERPHTVSERHCKPLYCERPDAQLDRLFRFI